MTSPNIFKIPKGTIVVPFVCLYHESGSGKMWKIDNSCTHTVAVNAQVDWYFTSDDILASTDAFHYYVSVPGIDEKRYNAFIVLKTYVMDVTESMKHGTYRAKK